MTKYRKAMDIPSSRQRRDWSLGDNGAETAAAKSEPSSEPNVAADEPESAPPAAHHGAADASHHHDATTAEPRNAAPPIAPPDVRDAFAPPPNGNGRPDFIG